MANALAIGGVLSLARSGDVIRLVLGRGRRGLLVPEEKVACRGAEPPLPVPPSKTPWQALYRPTLGHLSEGAVMLMEEAVAFRGVAARTPRHNHCGGIPN